MTRPMVLDYRQFTRHGRTERFRHRTSLVLDEADRPRYICRRLIRIAPIRQDEAYATPARTQRRKPSKPKQTRRPDEEAEAAESAKSAFLSCVSHELRTPLTSILSGLSMVLDGMVESPAQAHELLHVAYACGQRLAGIIDEILEVSTLEAGLLKVDLRPVKVGLLLDDLNRLMRPIAEKKGLLLECQVADPTKQIQTDPDLLRQILVYLVVNAVKFTDVGRVTLGERLDGDRIELSVADTGIGIAPDVQTKLFRPFVQGDNSSTRRYGGLGLGLNLAHRLTELIGGSLTLQSAGVGHGSTLIISLPLALGDNPGTRRQELPEKAADRRLDKAGEHDH